MRRGAGIRSAIAIAGALIATVGCGDSVPPHVVASIDQMVAYGDCDTGDDDPGDFFFSIAIEEELPALPAPAGAEPASDDVVSAAEAVYVLLDLVDEVLVHPSSSPDPVKLPRLKASAPFDQTAQTALLVTFSVYENDPDGPQWSAEEVRPMSWYPEEQCWKQYGDKGCVARERGDLIWEGDLDLGSEGTYCDVEIDWSITYR